MSYTTNTFRFRRQSVVVRLVVVEGSGPNCYFSCVCHSLCVIVIVAIVALISYAERNSFRSFCIVSISTYRCQVRTIANDIHSNGIRTHGTCTCGNKTSHIIYTTKIDDSIAVLKIAPEQFGECSVPDCRLYAHSPSDTDPYKWCDGTWANRLWIRYAATLSANVHLPKMTAFWPC